ncbi:Ammonium transporter 1 member 1 [Tetrabaena socialis]|uniref:Ammonium transporter 1 member 1 n=1 Tax=Tetrabaena socialis TaxID=47790 RepID=A0A2J7ZJH5_9CHLO|nr:Ammonium transporter 1 member 1 [Tetrabaena socialis]|eukprot:PNH00416.1 Ammonium transporter 1 member 1 [Tetrabaena socialis]
MRVSRRVACCSLGATCGRLLAKRAYICESYGRDCAPGGGAVPHGLFYGGGGRLLASQVIGILTIAAWVLGLMSLLFFALKLMGRLRISAQDEQAGLDISKHGGSAYYPDDRNRPHHDPLNPATYTHHHPLDHDHGLSKPDKAHVPATPVAPGAAGPAGPTGAPAGPQD